MNAKLTKGLAAAAISAAMMLGAAAPALAVESSNALKQTPEGKYYLTKSYTGVSDGKVSENVKFDVTAYKVTDAKITAASDMPQVSINETQVESGKSNQVLLNLPDFNTTGAGYYYYEVKEDESNNAAGVKYDTHTYYLKVTVGYTKNDQGAIDYTKTEVVSVSLWDKDPSTENSGAKKVAGFENTYESGTLEVKKVLDGNLTQDTDKFTINVTFTSDKPVDSDVKYTDLDGEHTINAGWAKEGDTYKATAKISVKGGSTVDFKNVPDGVSYSVEEEAPGNGYEAPKYDENKNGSLTADKDTSKADVITTVTNTKKSEVDTGVLLNNAPYIAILGGAAVVTIYVVNKRRHSDMD
jgi:hypothetical protein